jgi:hypothetical protein
MRGMISHNSEFSAHATRHYSVRTMAG